MHTNSKGSFVFVHVAPDARNCEVLQEQKECYKKGDLVYLTEENLWRTGNVILPSGSYTFLFTTNTAINEDAGKVVERVHNGFVDYTFDMAMCFTATQSLTSLIKSIGLDGDKNYAVLKVK